MGVVLSACPPEAEKRLEIEVDREEKILGQLPQLPFGFSSLPKERRQIKWETFSALRVRGAERLSIA
jgi:hypothetical protein